MTDTGVTAGLGQMLLDLIGQVPEGAATPDVRVPQGESHLLIDGHLGDSATGRTFANINPATDEVIGEVADAAAIDIERAIGSARRAFDHTTWSRDAELRSRCLTQLADAMQRHADVYRHALVAELGCPLRLTYGVHIDPVVEKVRYFADLASSYRYAHRLPDRAVAAGRMERDILREPLGVVGAITPWNIPVDINIAKVAAAVAAGCTVILKPAPDTPWAATILGRLIAEETDFPPGTVNIVPSSDPSLGALLTSDDHVDAVSFTGSTATGRRIIADSAATVKKVMLELGGKCASVVLDDAELEFVVPLAAAFSCFNTGQSCILPSRLLVPRRRLEECIELAQAGLGAVRVGDPRDPSTFMGPLVSRVQLDRVEALLGRGLAQGGTLRAGGHRDQSFPAGCFFEPTLVTGVEPGDVLAQEEIFGPVLVVIAYEDDEDAIGITNGTPYGLAAYVWTGDEEHGRVIARRLRVGMVGINGGDFTSADMPFGGVRQSGVGREYGVAGVEEFLEYKTIALRAG